MTERDNPLQWPTWRQLYRTEFLWKPIGWSKHTATRLRLTIEMLSSDPTTAGGSVAVAVKDWGNGPGNGPDGIEELRRGPMWHDQMRLGPRAVSMLLALIDEWRRQQGQIAK